MALAAEAAFALEHGLGAEGGFEGGGRRLQVTPADLGLPGQAAVVLDAVRRRVATWADPGLVLRRACEAARLSLELLCRGGMASALGASGSGVLRLARVPEARPLWIVGDVRGDVLALATALAFVDEADQLGDRAFVAFLGDWTGGVTGDAACTAMVLERFNAAPDRTLLLRGDREWACDAPGAPMATGLRTMPVPEGLIEERDRLARLVRLICERLPALALLPDGVALAHGSLPRLARLAGIDSAEALERCEPALRDCVLGRVHPSEMRVAPGGREGGALLGAEDFAQSAEALSRALATPVTRLVRAHDGAPEGFRWFRHCGEGAVLTVTTMADRVERGGALTRRCPCLARLKGGTIRVVRIEIPEEACFLCEQLFPRHGNGGARSAGTAEASRGRVAGAPTGPMPEAVAALAQSDAASTPSEATPAVSGKAAQALFERGVRLLEARGWGGALDCFDQAARHAPLRHDALLNASVACLWMGMARHQDALARLRELLRQSPRDEAALLNLGIALLAGERNATEACRVLRTAVEIDATLADAWWALGLALVMRSDASGAANAFAQAAEKGCGMPVPAMRNGLISEREMAPALDALRGRLRQRNVRSLETGEARDRKSTRLNSSHRT